MERLDAASVGGELGQMFAIDVLLARELIKGWLERFGIEHQEANEDLVANGLRASWRSAEPCVEGSASFRR